MRTRSLIPLLFLAMLAGACTDRQTVTPLAVETAVLASAAECELGLPLAEVYDALDALQAEIDALEAAGALNSGQAKALRNHLANARRHLDAGRTCPALAQLRAFRAQVGNFAADGVLTPEQAAPLQAGIDRVIEGDVINVTPTISGNAFSTCALTTRGALHCWGSSYGHVPVRLMPHEAFLAVSVGFRHSCAIRLDGVAFCWGWNNRGQLGIGSTSPDFHSHPPTQVSGDHVFTSISAHGESTCGVRADGVALCWGLNSAGQLGDGTTTQRLVPTPVAGNHRFIAIAAGESRDFGEFGMGHTCALRTDRQALCWGRNASGQLGDGTFVSRLEPTLVSGGHQFTSLDAGLAQSCGVRSDGTLLCWGQNQFGQLGDGTTTPRHSPVEVLGVRDFTAVSLGGGQSCGLRTNGSMACWGWNEHGQLGDGTTTDRPTPAPPLGDPEFIAIGAGTFYTCGIRRDGVGLCWGSNLWGNLGDGTQENRLTPTAVVGWNALP
jgi:alpha-tubulin suppressor-like RCC1 family protein